MQQSTKQQMEALSVPLAVAFHLEQGVCSPQGDPQAPAAVRAGLCLCLAISYKQTEKKFFFNT